MYTAPALTPGLRGTGTVSQSLFLGCAQVCAMRALSSLMLTSDTQAQRLGPLLGSCLRKPLPYLQDARTSITLEAAAAGAAAAGAQGVLLIKRAHAFLLHLRACDGKRCCKAEVDSE